MDPAIIIFGFGIGAMVGMTGMGGGTLMTPLLILLFGVKPVTAIGTDIFYAAVTKTVGGWRHLRMGTVNIGPHVLAGARQRPRLDRRRLGDLDPAEQGRRRDSSTRSSTRCSAAPC